MSPPEPDDPGDPSKRSDPGAAAEPTAAPEPTAAAEPTQAAEPAAADDDEIVATLSDYLDGTLAADRRAEVDAKLAGDAQWRAAHAELVETRKALSGLHKARAPSAFSSNVTATIHRRSAGRFFARRTLGDRVPFGALLVVAVLGLVAIAYVLWASQTGSLKVDRARDLPQGSASVRPSSS